MTVSRRVAVGALPMLLAAGAFASPAVASFPGRNGLIGFVADRTDDCHASIYTVRPGRRKVRQISEDSCGAGVSSAGPAWRPDGKRVLYSRLATDTSNDGWAVVVAADGSRRRIRKRISFSRVSWSPEREPLAWNIHTELWVGTFSRPRSRFIARQVTDAELSPNGRYLAVAQFGCGGISLYRPRSGRMLRQLVVPPGEPADDCGASSYTLDWSPNSRKLVYSDGFDIATVSRRSGKQRLVRRWTCCGGRAGPVWSPNGKWIAYSRQIPGRDRFSVVRTEIHAVRPNGRRHHVLLREGGGDLSWQPRPRR